jgi:16S rRNA A1518/A1519 N6-dimethyltransferase RsmA/KsgA/DIM1 with predicted DNA glycosylase/AP lyase activity
MFTPVPKVDSMVIKLDRTHQLTLDQITFIEGIFTQKRKTLMNNLSSKYTKDKEIVRQFLMTNEYDEQTRAEELLPDQILNLANLWLQLPN